MNGVRILMKESPGGSLSPSARSQQSIKQEAGSHQTPALPVPWPWRSHLQNCKREISVAATSLVAQGLKILLVMQRAEVRSPVQEDFTCCGASEPTCS